MTKKIEVPKANHGFGYVGVWRQDRKVGWWGRPITRIVKGDRRC